MSDRLVLEPKNATIVSLMTTLETDATFKHVDALRNKAKRSSIVRSVLSEAFTGTQDQRVEVQFQEFERKGNLP